MRRKLSGGGAGAQWQAVAGMQPARDWLASAFAWHQWGRWRRGSGDAFPRAVAAGPSAAHCPGVPPSQVARRDSFRLTSSANQQRGGLSRRAFCCRDAARHGRAGLRHQCGRWHLAGRRAAPNCPHARAQPFAWASPWRSFLMGKSSLNRRRFLSGTS